MENIRKFPNQVSLFSSCFLSYFGYLGASSIGASTSCSKYYSYLYHWCFHMSSSTSPQNSSSVPTQLHTPSSTHVSIPTPSSLPQSPIRTTSITSPIHTFHTHITSPPITFHPTIPLSFNSTTSPTIQQLMSMLHPPLSSHLPHHHTRPPHGPSARPPPPPFSHIINSSESVAARAPKLRLDAPKFDGTDPIGWIFRVEEYFQFYNTPPDEHLRLICLLLESTASEWFRWLRNNTIIHAWEDFVSQVRLRFDPNHFEDYFGALSNLKQSTTVAAYHTEFERLLNKVTGVPEAALLSVFIAGLKPHLRHEMNFRRPPSLSAAFALARELSALHQETHFAASAQQAAVSNTAPRPATITPDSSRPPAPSSRPDHQSLPIRKLSFAEKQIKDAQGLCYNCD